jgi:hypothetical protein
VMEEAWGFDGAKAQNIGCIESYFFLLRVDRELVGVWCACIMLRSNGHGLSSCDIHTYPQSLDLMSSLRPHPTKPSPAMTKVFQAQSSWILEIQFQIYL